MAAAVAAAAAAAASNHHQFAATDLSAKSGGDWWSRQLLRITASLENIDSQFDDNDKVLYIFLRRDLKDQDDHEVWFQCILYKRLQFNIFYEVRVTI